MDGSTFGMRGFEPVGPQGRSAWRLFPWIVAAVMSVVIAVNVVLVVTALRSFPGAAEGNGFALSNAYNQVLQDEAKQEALGWSVLIELDEMQRPTLTLTDRDGRALGEANVVASAARPLGPPQTTPLDMHAVTVGHYRSAITLARGQWDVTLQARRGDDVVRAVRRLIVR